MSADQQTRIQDAALAVLTAQGADGLTMRALAKQLGVEAPSLYHHLSNKEALINLVVHGLVDRLPTGASGQTVPEATAAFGDSVTALLGQHPGLASLLAERPERARLLASRAQGLVGSLLAAGLEPEQAQLAVLDLSWLLIGRAAWGHSDATLGASTLTALVQSYPAAFTRPPVAAAPSHTPAAATPPAASSPRPAAPPPAPQPQAEQARRSGIAGRLLRRAGHLLGGDD